METRPRGTGQGGGSWVDWEGGREGGGREGEEGRRGRRKIKKEKNQNKMQNVWTYSVWSCFQSSCPPLSRGRWYGKRARKNENVKTCAGQATHKQQLEEPCAKEEETALFLTSHRSWTCSFAAFCLFDPCHSHSTHIDSHHPHTHIHATYRTLRRFRRLVASSSQGCGWLQRQREVEAGAAAFSSPCCQHSSFLANHGAWRASCPRG